MNKHNIGTAAHDISTIYNIFKCRQMADGTVDGIPRDPPKGVRLLPRKLEARDSVMRLESLQRAIRNKFTSQRLAQLLMRFTHWRSLCRDSKETVAAVKLQARFKRLIAVKRVKERKEMRVHEQKLARELTRILSAVMRKTRQVNDFSALQRLIQLANAKVKTVRLNLCS